MKRIGAVHDVFGPVTCRIFCEAFKNLPSLTCENSVVRRSTSELKGGYMVEVERERIIERAKAREVTKERQKELESMRNRKRSALNAVRDS